MKYLFAASLLASTMYAQQIAPVENSASNVDLVKISTIEGSQRLQKADALIDFAKLVSQYESQTNKMFCGPTTMAIVLNALRANDLRTEVQKVVLDQSLLDENSRKSLPPKMSPVFNRYTQNNVFDPTMVKGEIKTKNQVLGEPMTDPKDPKKTFQDFGIQLRQLHNYFVAHGTKATLHIVDDHLDARFIKKNIIKNLSEPDNYVVVNYQRKVLGQKGGGHISPLGAYHKKTDSVLVMDVNPNTSDWVWVKLDDLIASMRTFDTTENRGYLLISDEH